MSPAAEYDEEAAFYSRTLRNAARHPIESVIELGSGGGNNALHMKRQFKEVCLVDISPGMLAISRALNPDLGCCCAIPTERRASSTTGTSKGCFPARPGCVCFVTADSSR